MSELRLAGFELSGASFGSAKAAEFACKSDLLAEADRRMYQQKCSKRQRERVLVEG